MSFFKNPEKIESKVAEVEAVGSSGTEIYGGYLSEEYLSALQGRSAQEIFKKIARSDYNAVMCLDAIKNPIKSTPSEIRVHKDDELGEAKKALCERVMSELATGREKLINEMLTCLDAGFYVGEVTFQSVLDNPIFDDEGKKVLQSYVGIKDIAFRSQDTIEKWKTDTHGRLEGVYQEAYGDLGRKVFIEKDALVHFAIKETGSNFEGVSMLRPVYGCWDRKNKYLKFNAIGIEKYAIPFVKGTMPAGAEDKQKQAFSQALRSIVASAKSFVRLSEGYDVEISSNSYDSTSVENSIDKEDMRMTRAFLANFLLLGQTGTGSRAVSNDLGQFFTNGLECVANLLESAINEQLKRVQIANFGKQAHYATFKFAGISDRFGTELANMLQGLVASNVIVSDDKLEDSVRKRLGVPEADRETSRASTHTIDEENKTFSLRDRVVARFLRD